MRDMEIGQVWLKIQRMIESCTTVRQIHNTENYYRLFERQSARTRDYKAISRIAPIFIELWYSKLNNVQTKEL